MIELKDQEHTRCPECKTHIVDSLIIDVGKGEEYCSNCGLVLQSNSTATELEWTSHREPNAPKGERNTRPTPGFSRASFFLDSQQDRKSFNFLIKREISHLPFGPKQKFDIENLFSKILEFGGSKWFARVRADSGLGFRGGGVLDMSASGLSNRDFKARKQIRAQEIAWALAMVIDQLGISINCRQSIKAAGIDYSAVNGIEEKLKKAIRKYSIPIPNQKPPGPSSFQSMIINQINRYQVNLAGLGLDFSSIQQVLSSARSATFPENIISKKSPPQLAQLSLLAALVHLNHHSIASSLFSNSEIRIRGVDGYSRDIISGTFDPWPLIKVSEQTLLQESSKSGYSASSSGGGTNE